MSKLIEQLQKSYQPAAPAMGFKTKTETPKNLIMPFIAIISPKNTDLVSDILAAGIDSLVIQFDEKELIKSTISELTKSLKDVLWGLLVSSISDEQIKQSIDTGCDFIIFEADNTPASLSNQEKLGKLLVINQSMSDGLVDSVGQLPIDAIVLNLHEESDPSMLHLMQCQYYVNLTDKPLFVIISTGVNASTLEALHKYGVDGVIIEIKTKSSIKQAVNMRQIINKLPPIKGRGKKKDSLIPSLGSPTPSSIDDDSDDYEEE